MQRPLYRLVIDTIVGRIAAGELPPGAMLPSEQQLGDELGVSQGTARKALMELERRGILNRHQGRGTFVALQTPESSLFHFFRLRYPDGRPIRPELGEVEVTRRPSTASEAAQLFEAPAEVVAIRRTRTHEGRAVVHETSVLPAALFPGLTERQPLPNTLYVLLQQAYGTIIVRAEEALRAASADEATAAALGIAPGAPVLCAERVAVDVLDRAVELRRSSYLTEDLIYAVSLD